jgi:hypothetical protein
MAENITIIILSQRSCDVKVRIKFSVYLIKHYVMTMYSSTYPEPRHQKVVSGQLHASAAYDQGQVLAVPIG